MSRNVCHCIVVTLLSTLAMGCQQGTSVPNPLAAFAPAHVPPPGTNSYQIPDRYYNKGQASANVPQAAASIASNDQAVGSGIAQSSFVDRGSAMPTNVAQSGGDMSNYRGYATSNSPSVQPQPSGISISPSSQDTPPAPLPSTRPSTSPLNWQSPVQ